MNANTILCLACSSSLPPRLLREQLFLTRCCNRPICPSCLAKNPRLARYDPCLVCLGGVNAVGARRSGTSRDDVPNVDGAVRDADLFVLGDDEDNDESSSDAEVSSTPPPSYEPPLAFNESITTDAVMQQGAHSATDAVSGTQDTTPEQDSPPEQAHMDTVPVKYYIQPNDTLLGLSLKLGVDARTLCRLNDLPPSTVRTSPHLLHTRTFLVLPPSHKPTVLPPPPSQLEADDDAYRARVRAQLRFQSVTREADWRVAQAYVALAEGEDAEPPVLADDKKAGAGVDGRAVDRYLDDDEWEEAERKAGRGVRISRFPGRGESSGGVKGWFARR
ncbi:hypothetical protein BV25DRAFT_1822488 [Artomyces pyxidatus]|uniref:Uncharacterized protein n=1 Tax=Artomyces pyxidatus TaxID=48021 RepID=A0ACB8T9R7_9AGAM|nr:hypothetical protein BV25DRAFT_1822488 [Artomyces pyxidatus]